MITESQMSALFKTAMDAESDTPIDPEQARQRTADAFASAIAQFVQGRTASGPTTDGATANVIID